MGSLPAVSKAPGCDSNDCANYKECLRQRDITVFFDLIRFFDNYRTLRSKVDDKGTQATENNKISIHANKTFVILLKHR